MDLPSSSRRMARPEQPSRHSLASESWFVARFLALNLFSATAKVSRPGRSPASRVSFARCAPACAALRDSNGAPGAGELAEKPGAARVTLTHSQNFIEPRFKVVFSLGPQANTLHGHGFFHRAHPAHQFLDILSRFLLIFAQILRLRHPHQESRLIRMFRLRHANGFGCEQSRVAGEQMFEAEIGH